MFTLEITGTDLSIEQLWHAVQTPGVQARLSPQARQQMERSRQLVQRWIERHEPVYGVTTGFGRLATVRLPDDELVAAQYNLIRSHSVGAGEWLPAEIVRAMLLLRANTLARGYSGVRPEVVELLLELFNAGIVPAIPRQGSVGASGDLVQLSHLALVLIGEGWCLTESGLQPAGDVLRQHGLSPLRLQPKEGLALINGTQMATAYGALGVYRARLLGLSADIIAALSVDALRGTDRAYDARIHRLRPFPGQLRSAQRLWALLQGSQIRESHRTNDPRVQDPYSLRCIPQVHGASLDAIEYVWRVVQTELCSVNDNPIVDPESGEHREGGHVHGQPRALALPFRAIASAELASLSERRIDRLVSGSDDGLPPFLTPRPGVCSGLMLAQYTAASLVSENKVLCHPASVDSIPTSAGQEDHNSMASIAAQKAWQVIENLQTVLAIELLCAAQAIEFRRPLRSSPPLERVLELVRAHVPPVESDRPLFGDIERLRTLIGSGALLELALPQEAQ
jgi:histidine ammonia-lyase